MKKLFLSAIIAMLALQLQAQTTEKTYSMSYLHGKEFPIATSEVNGDNFKYYIFCASWESDNDDLGFLLSSKDVTSFIEKLREVKNKYEEWSNTAKENSITKYDKDFDIKFPSVDCFFKYGDYHIDGKRKPNLYFKVTSDGDCMVILSIKNLQATDNRYIKHDGLFIAFSSSEEIENFIEAIDPTNIYQEAKDKASRDDLFH